MNDTTYAEAGGFKSLSNDELNELNMYRRLSHSGRLLEYYEKDPNTGHWHDMTAIMQAKEELERLQEAERRAERRRRFLGKAVTEEVSGAPAE